MLDGFCGHRPNGNECNVCDMRLLSHRITRVLKHEQIVTNQAFLDMSLKYLLYTVETQVYYHLGDHIQYDFLPRLLERLGKCLVDPQCDHQTLLKYHPALTRHYRRCLQDLSLTEHIFSADSNFLRITKSSCDSRIERLQLGTSFSVSLYWENPYQKSLAAARKFFSNHVLDKR